MSFLPEVLRVLPLASQQQVLGESFSSVAACREVCKELRDLCSVTVSHVNLDIGSDPKSALAELRCSRTSPVALFPAATRLSLRLPGATLASVQATSMLLRGMAPESRQRVMHVVLEPTADHGSLDYLQLLMTLGEQLPCLQSLEVDPHCCDHRSGLDITTITAMDNSRGRLSRCRPHSGRLLSLLGAVATFMPGLQRLALPGLTCSLALPHLGILAAACPQLRELTLTTCDYEVTAPMRLTEAGLAALGRLTVLERLTLGCLEVGMGADRPAGEGAWQPPPQQQQGGDQGEDRAQDELRPLRLLLGARRPPRLRCLTLEGGFTSASTSASGWELSSDRLEVSFLPGLGIAVAVPGVGVVTGHASDGFRGVDAATEEQRRGGWGISRVLVQPPPRLAEWSLDATAAELLAAAEALGQRQLPELVIPQLCVAGVQQGQVLQWQAVPRLAARCGRLELRRLVLDRSLGRGEGVARAATQVARVLGLPVVMQLKHGDWGCSKLPLPLLLPQPPPPASTDTATAGQQPPQQDQPEAAEQRPQKRQKLEQQRHQHPQQQHQHQQQLGSTSPLDLPVATPEQVLAAALDRLWAQAGRRDAAGGRNLYLVMRRRGRPHTLPEAAVAAEAAAHRSLLSQRADCQHVSVPALGALLLQCDSGVDAAMLARRLSPAAAADGCSASAAAPAGWQQQQQQQQPQQQQEQQQPAVMLHVGVPHAGFSAGSLFKQAVLQVLSDTWTGAGGHYGTGAVLSSNGGGSGESDVSGAASGAAVQSAQGASADALGDTGCEREAVAARLGRIVDLDRRVWLQWKRLEPHKLV
ncbi:hypothetical protein HYH02_011963 [Chlamydomonas schloesseri]|uniref:Uncharacterized protein n=1 Tax=Chlamydomonas schloesseri TaxID=2026947 RepID=A0A835W330_9CHLO|nr:hypothetical protein HYH02_011963 [Chlamydomonas schloesseri]|eukprot:KAG2435463.1 hypothetical protein HYH02_011963 [Chlamydomonas schloesseri]